MKNLNQILIISAVTTTILLGNIAFAEKMSTQTTDSVIERMERVISTLEKTDPSWVASQQRLADLLSERARVRFMSEVEANCNDGCKGSKKDRTQAINIYEDLLKNVKINDNSNILFQLAHLYDMAGQQDKSMALFERIIKDSKTKKFSAEIVSRSHSGLGDLLFQKGKFKEARTHFAIALQYKDVQNRGLIIYNMAWCDFNLDKLNSGIASLENLLRTPNQITRETPEGPKYDAVFHTDVIKDLATFYSRRNISNQEIAGYEAFAPVEQRKDLLLHFAGEADRLGQKQAARKIYNRYLEDPNLTKEERLSAFIKLAQVNYDAGMTSQSTQDFAKAAEAFQKTCPDTSKCPELEKTMKKYVTELHRSKKTRLDMDVLNSYVVYARTFPHDLDMAQRGAAVADNMGKYAVAVIFLRAAADYKTATPDQKQKMIAGEISAAEKSKDPVLQKAAYEHYLAVFPKGEKSFEVRYQLAYLNYTQKNFRDAAAAFNVLAKTKDGKADLRKKSADLSLDSLVQMKYEESLEEWAWEYAEVFPQARLEFETLARKALANRTSKIANDKKASNGDLQKALNQLQKAKMASASNPEKIIHYNNMIVLSQRLNDEIAYIGALRTLMALPGLTAERKEEATGQLVGYFEKKLDFRSAYATALKMKFNKMSDKDKQLRLGTLADLANMNPVGHYKAALASGLRGDNALSLRQRLVILATNPVRELKAQAPELARRPSLLNETTLLVFAKTNDRKGLKSILAMKELRNQTAPNFIAKQDFYSEIGSFKNKIAAHQLNGKSDSAMGRTLKERMALLKKADAFLGDSLKFKDVTAQMLALDIVARENDRMVRDIVALPVPAKLNEKEQAQYLAALKAQSKPYFTKSKVAAQKESEMWEGSASLSQLVRDYRSVRPELKRVLKRELQLLAAMPNGGKLQSEVNSALNDSTLSINDLNSARKTVSANPTDVGQIENLKNLETKIGHPLMPAYLDARLSQLQRGRSL
ncbi:MAG: tetratricopeptide repeat protein [Proteobacteria bacterium]|nr:MAG: tetratricopeptide repeat protein [Pseudomonadota bacterium]